MSKPLLTPKKYVFRISFSAINSKTIFMQNNQKYYLNIIYEVLSRFYTINQFYYLKSR